jgi:hypothetical protein
MRHALWIGGAQWAGKSTVAGILAERHGLTCYRYHYHNARGHQDRWLARRHRHGGAVAELDLEAMWVRGTPQGMAQDTIARCSERFEWVQDDLRALTSPRPVLADGWGLRPELVAPVTESLRRMVVMVLAARDAHLPARRAGAPRCTVDSRGQDERSGAGAA